VPVRRLERVAAGLALLLAAAVSGMTLAGCSVTVADPDYTPPAPLPALEQLKQAPLTDPAAFTAGEDVLAFVTADRNVVCALTSARGPHLNLPYEANNFGDADNGKLATVPVAHCELAVYPAPAAADVSDDCSGTGLGYLGGAALLTPDRARYGECRSGVTQMEIEYGPKGTPGGPVSKLPVLPDGGNLERNGLRCSAYRSGVACGNVSAGVGFFISRDHYELIPATGKNAQTAPAKPPKTP
jgi:hypothetical protein